MIYLKLFALILSFALLVVANKKSFPYEAAMMFLTQQNPRGNIFSQTLMEFTRRGGTRTQQLTRFTYYLINRPNSPDLNAIESEYLKNSNLLETGKINIDTPDSDPRKDVDKVADKIKEVRAATVKTMVPRPTKSQKVRPIKFGNNAAPVFNGFPDKPETVWKVPQFGRESNVKMAANKANEIRIKDLNAKTKAGTSLSSVLTPEHVRNVFRKNNFVNLPFSEKIHVKIIMQLDKSTKKCGGG